VFSKVKTNQCGRPANILRAVVLGMIAWLDRAWIGK
jgi:hypothetical protein